MEWTPASIRALREQGLCLPQDRFATILGFTKRTVGNAERGEHPPSLALRQALDNAVAQASDLQRNRFLEAVATEDNNPPEAHHATVFATPTLESIELLRSAEASDLDRRTVEQLQELVEHLGTRYFAIAPADFRETVLLWRRYVARLLGGKVTLNERRELYAVAGWLSGLLAEVSLALGDEAQTHCATALALANEVGHAQLAGWVRGTQAQVAFVRRRPARRGGVRPSRKSDRPDRIRGYGEVLHSQGQGKRAAWRS
ncbi:MAG TPA: hypothetical protein VGI84_00250 [Pseudonocardiaceae bacterium]